MGGTLGSTHEAAKLLVFPCNGALMGSLKKAGYGTVDLPKLCQDEDGNPAGVPPEIRTELEAAKRAGVRFLILANTQSDIAIYRIVELLKTIGIKDYEIRVENFGDSTGEVETLARICSLVEGRPKVVAKPFVATRARAAVSPVLMPTSFMQRDDFFGRVARSIVETTDQPQPEFAVAAAACLTSVMVGNRIYFDVGPHRVWPHLNALCLGPSTCGKDWPRKCLDRIIEAAADDFPAVPSETKEIRFLYGSSSIRSDAGIRYELMTKSTTTIFAVDEIGDLLEKVNTAGPGQGHLSGIAKTLKELKHGQGRFYRPGGTGTDGTCEIWSPHLVIYGSSTPDRVWDNISVNAVEGGFLNRFQIFEGGIPETLVLCREWRMDEDVVQTIRNWRLALSKDIAWGKSCAEAADTRGRIGARPEAFGPRLRDMIKGKVDGDANKLWLEFNRECHAKKAAAHRAGDGLRVAVWGRVAECAAQMATIFACGGFQKSMEISCLLRGARLTKDCMAEGIVWARCQAAKVLARIDRIGGEEHHRSHDLVAEIIQRNSPITHRTLQRMMRRKFPEPKMLQGILANLVSGAQVRIDKGAKGGNVYYWEGDDDILDETETAITVSADATLPVVVPEPLEPDLGPVVEAIAHTGIQLQSLPPTLHPVPLGDATGPAVPVSGSVLFDATSSGPYAGRY